MTDAKTIRATADQAAIAAELARWPNADEIPPRDSIGHEPVLGSLPAKLDACKAALHDALAKWQEELRHDIARYEAIRTRGLDEISDFDLSIAYGGDPLAALRGSLRLKTNHVSYHRTAIVLLLSELARTEAAIEAERRQLALF